MPDGTVVRTYACSRREDLLPEYYSAVFLLRRNASRARVHIHWLPLYRFELRDYRYGLHIPVHPLIIVNCRIVLCQNGFLSSPINVISELFKVALRNRWNELLQWPNDSLIRVHSARVLIQWNSVCERFLCSCPRRVYYQFRYLLEWNSVRAYSSWIPSCLPEWTSCDAPRLREGPKQRCLRLCGCSLRGYSWPSASRHRFEALCSLRGR